MVPALYAHDPFLAIQAALRAPWLDGPMAVASVACEGWAVALVAAAFFLPRERGLRAGARALLPVLAGLLLSGLAVQLLKQVVALPRPLSVYGAAEVHVLLEPLHRRAFPSGHAASAAALAAFALLRHGRAGWPLLLLALVGGVSRVYVGAHWALDVAAGWALGAAVALATSRAWRRWAPRLVPASPGATATAPALLDATGPGEA